MSLFTLLDAKTCFVSPNMIYLSLSVTVPDWRYHRLRTGLNVEIGLVSWYFFLSFSQPEMLGVLMQRHDFLFVHDSDHVGGTRRGSAPESHFSFRFTTTAVKLTYSREIRATFTECRR